MFHLCRLYGKDLHAATFSLTVPITASCKGSAGNAKVAGQPTQVVERKRFSAGIYTGSHPWPGTETQWAVMHESSKVKNSPHLHEMAHAPRQEVSLPELSRWGPGRCRGILNPARRYKGLLHRLCSWRCALLSRLHGAYGPCRLVEVC